ncbi:MAG: type II toxin-antitoxin system VapC family toxin [Spirochaetes bacterium]|nr:MAG: type II toxin-antitoxin system VapC family toxin [Spirochaetota bacterium]
MKVLLDTQIVIWWNTESSKIEPVARELIGDSLVEKLVSHATLWEMAIKIRIGKLIIRPSLFTFVEQNIKRNGMQLLPIDEYSIYATQNLELHHQDPFDRLIIAQAIVGNIPVITSDKVWGKYPVRLLI